MQLGKKKNKNKTAFNEFNEGGVYSGSKAPLPAEQLFKKRLDMSSAKKQALMAFSEYFLGGFNLFFVELTLFQRH